MQRTWTYLEILDALSAAMAALGGSTQRDCDLVVRFKKRLTSVEPQRKGRSATGQGRAKR